MQDSESQLLAQLCNMSVLEIRLLWSPVQVASELVAVHIASKRAVCTTCGNACCTANANAVCKIATLCRLPCADRQVAPVEHLPTGAAHGGGGRAGAAAGSSGGRPEGGLRLCRVTTHQATPGSPCKTVFGMGPCSDCSDEPGAASTCCTADVALSWACTSAWTGMVKGQEKQAQR